MMVVPNAFSVFVVAVRASNGIDVTAQWCARVEMRVAADGHVGATINWPEDLGTH